MEELKLQEEALVIVDSLVVLSSFLPVLQQSLPLNPHHLSIT